MFNWVLLVEIIDKKCSRKSPIYIKLKLLDYFSKKWEIFS